MMSSFDLLKAQRRQIAERSAQQFDHLLSLFDEAVSLLIDASEIIETHIETMDHRTTDGASQAATWRFLSTLPTSATWCYEAALNGDYSIAKNILRLTLEETVRLIYYVKFPDKALRQITRDRDQDETDIGDMLKELEFEHRTGLLRLHGELSTFYSHANLNLPPEVIFKGSSGRTLIGGGPRFSPELFEPIAHQILVLVANALKYLLVRFPMIIESSDWQTRFERYMLTVAEIIPRQEASESTG